MTHFKRLSLHGLVEITPAKHSDARGFFSETFKASDFYANGLPTEWVQDNQSFSAQVGTIRGIHFQAPPFAQHKLVRVLRGAIYDVAVDLRRGSPNYGNWESIELSAEKWNQLLIPIGFGHGFMTLTDDVEVTYKVSAPYSREHEGAVLWSDPHLAIAWPDVGVEPALSSKDMVAPSLAEHVSVFEFQGR